MTNFKPLPRVSRIKELLTYEPETGKLFWKQKVARWISVGDEAGTHGHCAVDITIDGITYRAHRIIWLLVTGEDPGSLLVDHINRDFHNNRICNLRLATHRQNQCNQKTRTDNSSGFKGVTWDSSRSKWQAAIQVNGKRVYLGRHKTKEKAYAAYCEAARRLHGEFAQLE